MYKSLKWLFSQSDCFVCSVLPFSVLNVFCHPLHQTAVTYFNEQYNAYFSRSVFGPRGTKKIILEEIIETIDNTHETSMTDPPKKRARISCVANSKSSTQVSICVVYLLFHGMLCGRL